MKQPVRHGDERSPAVEHVASDDPELLLGFEVEQPAALSSEGAGIRRHRRRVVAMVVTCFLLVPGVSFGRALTAPGAAPASVRTVEWVREHGGSRLVDAAENWWFARHVAGGATPHTIVRAPAGSLVSHTKAGPMPPGPVAQVTEKSAGGAGVTGEGQWSPGRTGVDGAPALYTTWFHPDPDHPQVVAAAAWVRAGDYRAHLVAGTRQPDGATWPGDARVDPNDVTNLLATFNAGFKFQDTPGGFYLRGRSSRPLQPGLATAAIVDTGRLEVGALTDPSGNSSVSPADQVVIGPHTVAARQNLQLIVEGGKVAAGLNDDVSRRWGTSRNQGQYTWRSALGVDQHGDLLYVGGNGLNLVHLARALVQAGAVRAMELDMHFGMVSFSSWDTHGSAPEPTKLLPDMSREADRYLAPDQRDFFYLTTK